MSTLEDLEAAFGSPTPGTAPSSPTLEMTVSDRYERRRHSLVTSDGGKWAAVLAGSHSYESDSEARAAVIWAMVIRHFTDGEVWTTLEPSALFEACVEKKV